MKANVNGEPARLDSAADPYESTSGPASGVAARGGQGTAAAFLRETMRLTGTKVACGTGHCGSCTILLDGTPVAGCLTPLPALAGREVTTVEGLDGAHPVQRAFAVHDALQCGYCTPGFVVEAAAYVDRWRAVHGACSPTRAQIAEALAGHLCRCGAYQSIYAAVAAACAGEHDQDDPDGGTTGNGASGNGAPARVEAMEKITGAARYTTDIWRDGRLDGVIVRSKHPHARVTSVRAADDVPLVELLPADRIVRYVGQAVAAVAAPTLAEALDAAARVEVGYEPLPAALPVAQDDPATAGEVAAAAAAAAAARLVHPTRADRRAAPRSSEGAPSPARWHGNLRGPAGISRRARTAVRRIERARAEGGDRLLSLTFSTAPQAHTALEPHACLARWAPGGDLHLHLSTQAVGFTADRAAERWGLRPDQVHVVAEHVGGGFGAKVNLGSELIAAVELARVTARPVRVVLSRAEEFVDGGSRPGTRTELSMLADDAGGLSALTMDVYGDGGVAVASNAASHALFIYGSAPRRLRDYDVVTNQPPSAPFRGPGHPPMLWALEQAVDEMAHRIGVDPITLRRRWDGNPKRQALYDWASELPAWRDRPTAGTQRGRYRRGVGLAIANYLYLLDPGTEVELTVEAGTVVARTATQDIGTGSRSVIADVVRTELGLSAGRVRVEIGRAGAGVPHGPPAAGSCSTASIGPAARDAAAALREALSGRSLDDKETDGLRVAGKRRRDRRGYVTPFALNGIAVGRGMSGAVFVTELEIDTRLGAIRVERVSCGIAAGRIYAPRLARSQCEGGIVQGLGYALHEQRVVDAATGVVLTDSLDGYHLPGIGDIPEIDLHFHTEGWEHVTGGGTGLGEICTMGVAASVGNAVHNATGLRPLDLPIRPDRLLEGLNR